MEEDAFDGVLFLRFSLPGEERRRAIFGITILIMYVHKKVWMKLCIIAKNRGAVLGHDINLA